MIIPIRCFTCGKLIAHLWNKYINTLQEEQNKLLMTYKDVISQEDKNSIENKILDELNITKYCCRRMFIAHVDLCDKI